MIDSLFHLLFSCAHKRTTFPLTPKRSGAASRSGTYVVCLECGKEFPFNWQEMRIERPERPERPKGVRTGRTSSWLWQPLLRFLS